MERMSMRIACGKFLVEQAGKNKDIVALEADLKESTQSVQFQNAFPDRYVEVGVAEQNMVGIAAGLSLAGKIPVVHSFACFISMRSCEQIRTTVCYPNLNVKFIASHGGISAGTAGTTHHAIEDFAIMRSIPNMTVIAPCDVNEMRQSLDVAVSHKGPVYIRLSAIETEDVYGAKDRFCIGKATKLKSGDDAAIITTGIMAHDGICAANILKKEYGLNVRVLQMASIKPLDKEAVKRAALETKYIVTVEEHSIIGGLGSAVCEVVSELGKARLERIGINDHFLDTGTTPFLMKREGLSVENIVRVVLALRQN